MNESGSAGQAGERTNRADDAGEAAGRPTQAERRALSQRRLLDAARRLIAEQGCSRTTLSEIGARAGYSRGMVAERFGSKRGLVEALAHEIQRAAIAHLEPALDGRTGLEAVLVAVDTYLEGLARVSETTRAFYVLMSESIGLVPEIRPTFASANTTFRGVVRRWLEDGMQAGEIRHDLDPEAQATWIVGALRGAALQWLVDPDGIEFDSLRAETRIALERSLRA